MMMANCNILSDAVIDRLQIKHQRVITGVQHQMYYICIHVKRCTTLVLKQVHFLDYICII